MSVPIVFLLKIVLLKKYGRNKLVSVVFLSYESHYQVTAAVLANDTLLILNRKVLLFGTFVFYEEKKH